MGRRLRFLIFRSLCGFSFSCIQYSAISWSRHATGIHSMLGFSLPIAPFGAFRILAEPSNNSNFLK